MDRSVVAELNDTRKALRDLNRLDVALEAYGEILRTRSYDAESDVGIAIQLGLESIDPSLDLKEGTYVTWRVVKELIIKAAKATREGLRILFNLIASLYVKFTGSLSFVRSQQKRLSRRLGALGNRVTYKTMEINGVNRLSVGGTFVGGDPKVFEGIIAVADALLKRHPSAVVKVARTLSRRFVDLVDDNPNSSKVETARAGMSLFHELASAHLVPFVNSVQVQPAELSTKSALMKRSGLLPGNWALVFTDVTSIDASRSRDYAETIRNSFYIDFVEISANSADSAKREMEVPKVATLAALLDGISRVLDIAEKSHSHRRDFETVKVVVDDAIRQVMDIQTADGGPNTVVIQMLGAVSETLAAPMGNFTHWLAVTINVYLNFINHCVKHYEADGV